jgi:hypothetical protein
MTGNRARAWSAVGLAFFAVAAAACGGEDSSSSDEQAQSTTTTVTQAEVAPADCSAKVDNRFVPLTSVKLSIFRGSERADEGDEMVATRVEQRVQEKTATIAGFPVRVVQVKDFEGGELVEQTLDYYTQCGDGSVWYVGEKVNDIEEGKVVSHGGQWLAGVGGAKAGLFMPAEPKVDETFQQERAPGVAEDRSTVVADDVETTTPAGKFTGCIRTKDFAPIDNTTEFKIYCPDVGLVREELTAGGSELVRYE